jgi:5-deoxy-glucuronate isomerase
MTTWNYTSGELARDGWQTVVDGAIEGWTYTGLRVAELTGAAIDLPASDVERLVVPLAGSFSVTYSAGTGQPVVQQLQGRESVFHGTTDVLYLGAGTSLTITGAGRVAVAEAPTDEVLPPVYLPASDVAVELRGQGRNSRQVHNMGTPEALAASRFMVVEVITPSANWSSYPPHKHDTATPGVELPLEEIYYFETSVTRGAAAPVDADPIGLMRTYSSSAGEIDVLAEVRTGDVVLVPYGYHGPCIAVPGYDLYFLNVMAGPEPERAWLLTDDPRHVWAKQVFAADPIDPRLPYGR